MVAFLAGGCPTEQVTYEAADWAFQKAVVSAFRFRPDLGVLNLDNIRVDRGEGVVRSAFLERLLHEAESTLYAPGTGEPKGVGARFVVVATVNDGRFSDDLLNRAVPIRLEAVGDLARRRSAVGDPKGEFLPQHRERIAGELRGVVERWKAAGRPLDESARHPSFGGWAKAVGGMLMVSGFNGFLANAVARRSEDDPVRRGLSELAAACHGEWLRSEEWAARIAAVGLTKAVIPAADRDTAAGRVRGAGVVLSNHARGRVRRRHRGRTGPADPREGPAAVRRRPAAHPVPVRGARPPGDPG